MNRRFFSQSMGSGAAWSAMTHGHAPKPGVFRLDHLYFSHGNQGVRIHKFLASQVPLLAANSLTFGVFTVVVAPHLPALVLMSGYRDMTELDAADERIQANAGYRNALRKVESASGALYERADRILLRATSHSPQLEPPREKLKSPRVFELRVNRAPTQSGDHRLETLASAEIGGFERSGIHPILIANTVAGPNMPNVSYLIPFANLAAREQAWDRLAVDAEWVRARQEALAAGVQCVAQSEIMLLRPTPFSPIQ